MSERTRSETSHGNVTKCEQVGKKISGCQKVPKISGNQRTSSSFFNLLYFCRVSIVFPRLVLHRKPSISYHVTAPARLGATRACVVLALAGALNTSTCNSFIHTTYAAISGWKKTTGDTCTSKERK